MRKVWAVYTSVLGFGVLRFEMSVCVKTEKKEGYILEKWEFYPFPKSVSTFLVLKPEHLKGAVPVSYTHLNLLSRTLARLREFFFSVSTIWIFSILVHCVHVPVRSVWAFH